MNNKQALTDRPFLNARSNEDACLHSKSEPFKSYIRCRPLNEAEMAEGNSRKSTSILDQHTLYLSDHIGKEHNFTISGIFDEQVPNEDIFWRAVKPLADNVLMGINSTVFAYGITGAGKSYTMFGDTAFQLSEDGCSYHLSEQAGIIPRTFEYLLAFQQATSIKIRLSYLEIYNEQIYDLLAPLQTSLQVSEDPLLGVIVPDLIEQELQTIDEALEAIELGNCRRMVAETKANQFSSRSHAIVIINVETTQGQAVYCGKFSLVDLAGSEKQNVHSQTRGIRTFEGSNINRSLLTLGNCINILSERRQKQQFIPYRDSKLTRLLKDSLGGNTKTVMIACISQSLVCYQETLNTLKYACRASKIDKVVKQNVKKNEQHTQKELARLRKQNDLLSLAIRRGTTMPDSAQIQRKKQKVYFLLRDLISCVERRAKAIFLQENFDTTLQQEEQNLINQILSQFEATKEEKCFISQNQNKQSHKQSRNIQKGCKEIPLASSVTPSQERNSVSAGMQLVNLQILRQKIREDKGIIHKFKENLKFQRVSQEEALYEAQQILNMEEKCFVFLNDDEKRFLEKGITEGMFPIGRVTLAEFKNIRETKECDEVQGCTKMAAKIRDQIGKNKHSSHNRHLQALFKVKEMLKAQNSQAEEYENIQNYTSVPVNSQTPTKLTNNFAETYNLSKLATLIKSSQKKGTNEEKSPFPINNYQSVIRSFQIANEECDRDPESSQNQNISISMSMSDCRQSFQATYEEAGQYLLEDPKYCQYKHNRQKQHIYVDEDYQ